MLPPPALKPVTASIDAELSRFCNRVHSLEHRLIDARAHLFSLSKAEADALAPRRSSSASLLPARLESPLEKPRAPPGCTLISSDTAAVFLSQCEAVAARLPAAALKADLAAVNWSVQQLTQAHTDQMQQQQEAHQSLVDLLTRQLADAEREADELRALLSEARSRSQTLSAELSASAVQTRALETELALTRAQLRRPGALAPSAPSGN
jgi:hypothetical protein